MSGAEMRRTVRRLTVGVAGSAVVASAVVTGTLMYNGVQPATDTESTDVAGTPPDETTPSAGESELQDDDNAAAPVAPVAPIQPPTIARGGGHASSGGS